MSNHNIKNGLDKINCKSLILCGSKDKANMKSANLMGRIFNYFEFTFSYTLTNLFRSVDRIDVDANYILGVESDNAGNNSIDARLRELPESQRQYFTTVFLTMLANYPAAA